MSRFLKLITAMVLLSALGSPSFARMSRQCPKDGFSSALGSPPKLHPINAFEREFPHCLATLGDRSAITIARDIHSVRALLGLPEFKTDDDDDIFGEDPPDNPAPFIRQGFEYLDQQTKAYSYVGRARLFDAMVVEIQREFVGMWRATGPYIMSDGSIAYGGGQNIAVIFSAKDSQVYIQEGVADPALRGAIPDFAHLKTLRQFLDRKK